MKRILALIAERVGEHDKNWGLFHDLLSSEMAGSAEVTMGELKTLVFETSDQGARIYDPVYGFDMSEFDLVVFKSIRQQYGRIAACASYLQEKSIPYVDTRVQPGAWTKYSAQAMHHAAGLPVIPAVFSSTECLIGCIEDDRLPFSYPIIIKDVNGNKGKFNFIARNPSEAVAILSSHMDIEFMLQKFIPNNGDYRCLVLGGEMKMAFLRKAKDGSHLNNTSMGAQAELVEVTSFSKEILNDVIRAATTEQLEVAGVDLIIDRETNRHYIIEVNGSPQMATGALPDQKMAHYGKYLKQLIQG